MDNTSILEIVSEVKQYHPALASRVDRAARLWQNGCVVEAGFNRWEVYGDSGKYAVTFNLAWGCTCPDCQGNGHAPAPVEEIGGSRQATCKHILAALMAWSVDGIGVAL